MFLRNRAFLFFPAAFVILLSGCPLRRNPAAVSSSPPSLGGTVATAPAQRAEAETVTIDSGGVRVRRLVLTSTFPAGATPGGTYTVTRANATIASGGVLFLPDKFTINVASDVDQINWQFDKIQFGNGATFDLSREGLKQKPAKAANGSSTLTCFKSPHECDRTVDDISDGGKGGNGVTGQLGINGTVLTLRVHSLPSSGSLWVKTDGGQGGPGGDGGNGGRGDWANSSGVHFHRGGNGGDGGNAGQGGYGGNSGVVRIEILDPQSNQVEREILSSCSGGFGPTTNRPPNTEGDAAGAMIVFGNPGLGGANGDPGAGAERGHGVPVNFAMSPPHDGVDGRNGTSVPPAANGRCYPAFSTLHKAAP